MMADTHIDSGHPNPAVQNAPKAGQAHQVADISANYKRHTSNDHVPTSRGAPFHILLYESAYLMP